MGTGFAITGHRCPPVGKNLHFGRTHIHHRLNRDDHAWLKPCLDFPGIIIGHLGFLVKFPPQAVAHKLFHHGKTKAFYKGFHATADLAEHFSWLSECDCSMEGLLGSPQQLMDFWADGPNRNTGGIVTDPAILHNTDVDFDNVAILNNSPGSANAMNDLLIEGNTNLAGKAPVVQKGTPACSIGHELGGGGVNFCGTDAGPHQCHRF